jgi:hypothetical protein
MLFDVRDYIFFRSFIGFGYRIGEALHFDLVDLSIPGAQDFTCVEGHGFNFIQCGGHDTDNSFWHCVLK